MFENVLCRGAVTVLVLSLGLTSAQAAVLRLTSDTVARQHQDPGTICVELVPRAGEQVAGTENLLVWDGECASILAESCEADPGHGKNLSGVVQRQRDFTYKGLVLSLTDTNPMPAGILYCCDFLVHAEPGDCCRIRIGSPGGSDPEGNSLSMGAGAPGQLCVEDDGRPRNDGIAGNIAGGGGLGGGGPVDTGGSSGGGTTGGTAGSSGGGSSAGLGRGAPAAPPAAIVADLGGDDRDAAPQDDASVAPGQSDTGPAVGEAGKGKAQPDAAAAAQEAVPQKAVPQKAVPRKKVPAAKEVPAAKKAADAPEAKKEAAKEAVSNVPAEGATVPETPEVEEAEVAEEAADPGVAPDPGGVDTEKPSPRDVRPAQSSSAPARDRRMPLDDDGGWFGCQVVQVVAPDRSASALALTLPALLLLLAGRRRRI